MFGLALVAAVQAAAAGQPRQRPLHGPTVSAKPLRGFNTPAGDARGDIPGSEPSAQVAVVIPLVGMELGGPTATWPAPGRRRRGPRRERIGGMPRTKGSIPWLSWVFAAETPIERGRPVRSVIKWIFEPFLPRSTGFGPVRSPLSPPACSPSRSRSATSPARRRHRARPAPGGGPCPRPGPGSTR